MVIISWICVIVATLRFEELIVLPLPGTPTHNHNSQSNRNNASNKGLATSMKNNGLLLQLLLPPWQRSLVLPTTATSLLVPMEHNGVDYSEGAHDVAISTDQQLLDHGIVSGNDPSAHDDTAGVDDDTTAHKGDAEETDNFGTTVPSISENDEIEDDERIVIQSSASEDNTYNEDSVELVESVIEEDASDDNDVDLHLVHEDAMNKEEEEEEGGEELIDKEGVESVFDEANIDHEVVTQLLNGEKDDSVYENTNDSLGDIKTNEDTVFGVAEEAENDNAQPIQGTKNPESTTLSRGEEEVENVESAIIVVEEGGEEIITDAKEDGVFGNHDKKQGMNGNIVPTEEAPAPAEKEVVDHDTEKLNPRSNDNLISNKDPVTSTKNEQVDEKEQDSDNIADDASEESTGTEYKEESKEDVESSSHQPTEFVHASSFEAEEGATVQDVVTPSTTITHAEKQPGMGNETSTTSSTTDEMIAMINVLASLAASTCIIYSIAVHSFLSNFHEQKFFHAKHWRQIVLRMIIALIISAVQWVILPWCVFNRPTYLTKGIDAIISFSSIILFTKLVFQTREHEINGPIPPQHISMKDKVVLITGANGGIGLETARQLYQLGATILLGCRSKDKALAAINDIEPIDQEKERLRFVQLDLTCQSSIHFAVKAIHDMKLPGLHVLINNAGVMRKKREDTVDGLEMTMAANHLGHFLLTNLLLPKLRETAMQEQCSTRVITVSSSLYCNAKRCNPQGKWEAGIAINDLQCKQKYKLFKQYAQSKLANILFALELGRRESKPISTKAISPQTEADQSQMTPIKKTKKKIRITPVEDTGEDPNENDEVGLGFGAIVSSPSKKKKRKKKLTPSNEEEKKDNDDPPTMKSKIRPKLIPMLDSDSVAEEDDEGDGLGFDHIVSSPTTTRTPNTNKKMSIKKKIAPISPSKITEDDSDDEIGLGFNDDILSTPKKKEKTRQSYSASSQESNEGGELKQPLVQAQHGATDKGSKQFFPVKSYCLHPGLVRTNVTHDMPWYLRYPNMIFAIFLAALQKHPREGAYTSVFCAVLGTSVQEDAKNNDECYFVNSELQPLDKVALDEEDAKQLWALSNKLVSFES